jgi:hypothetical protein
LNDQSKIGELAAANREHAIKALLKQAKQIAVMYYELTKKPLGVTGEVAEYEAADKLGLTLEAARSPTFDACREEDGKKVRFQIKGRAVTKVDPYRGRVPKIKDGEFDAVLLILLDKKTLDALEIWRADRTSVMARLDEPGGRARNERRSMGISQFRSIAERIWPV